MTLPDQIKTFGNSERGASVVFLHKGSDQILVGRKNCKVESLDPVKETFTEVMPQTKLELAFGGVWEEEVVRGFSNGFVEVGSGKFKSGVKEMKAVAFKEKLAVCGKDVPEVRDANLNTVWRGRTLKREETIFETDCEWLDPCCLVTCDTFNTLKIYDIRAGKKPTSTKTFNDKHSTCYFSFTKLSVGSEYLCVGDAIGHIYKVDLSLGLLGKTKGRSVGAIKALETSDSGVYSAGLDRTLRVHSPSLDLLHKTYLWQKVTSLIVLS